MRIRRRWKVLAAGIMALLCILVLFNLWFVQNTNTIIESLVRSKSGGNIGLQLSRSKFNYFSKKLQLYDAVFYTTVDTGAATVYQFRVAELNLKLRSLWAFIAHRELLIDSIALQAPEVIVTKISKREKQQKESVSIPEEIGRVYNSILDALQVLQVKRFQISDGRFRLIDNMDTTRPVTAISNINFYINNLKIAAETAASEKFLYSDNVVLRVTNQDITLPDGRHRLAFKNLLINARKRQVVLDSCWVRAQTPNSYNAFRIFFDALRLDSLDFTALYKRNLIKADSVYVTDPLIEIALDRKRKREKTRKLELDTIIQQFTGDLDLGYIGVQNATVNITAHRGDTTTTFRSANDNFRMYGLRVNSDAEKPVSVDEFTMVLRKYETYSRDSSTLYRFDSLRFINDRVRLSNFTIQSITARRNGGWLNYSIPAFELTDLSWEDLLFDRQFRAGRAVLINPDIEYSIGAVRRSAQKTSLFKVLSGLSESVALDEVEIRNGNLNIQLPGGKRLSLQQVNLILASNRLLASTTYTGMQQAINELQFRNALFTTGTLRAELINLQYADRLYADELRVTNNGQNLTARAKGISLNDLVWNNEDKSVFVDGLAWRQANVTIRPGGKKISPKATNAILQVRHLAGKNTAITLHTKKGAVIKTVLDKVVLNNLEKRGSDPVAINGFTAGGRALEMTTAAFGLKSGPYQFVDGGASSIRAVSFLRQSLTDTVRLAIPQTFFTTHVSDLLNGDLHFDKVTASAPDLSITSGAADGASRPARQPASLPRLRIGALQVLAPTIRYTKQDSAQTTVHWANSGNNQNNHWTFSNAHTIPGRVMIAARKATLSGEKFLVTRNGKPMGIDSGSVQLNLANLEVVVAAGLKWSAFLEEALFKNPISVGLRRRGGIGVEEGRVRRVQLSDANTKNIYELLQSNPAMQLELVNGSFANEKAALHWKDMAYSQRTQSLSIDSFSYRPALERDSAIARAPGQTDYMHAVLKNMTIDGIDLTKLERDSTFNAHRISIETPSLDIYRDKRKPFISPGHRLLPTLALQTVGAKFAVDTVALHNATVTYTEMSEKTGQEGTITVNRINAQLFPVRNINIGATDSLSLRAEGYLMDSAWLRLRLRESYTDSLGTFVMTLRMKPTDLSILNQALIPMASVKLLSGSLDTIFLRAVGHDYYSIGDMHMYYNNLKIQLLKKGSETQKTLLTRLITFVANNLVIKKSNTQRTGTVYFLRKRDRSIFNFIIKTAMSGMASSVGAKKNKKYYKQYKRQQKLRQLPPVELY